MVTRTTRLEGLAELDAVLKELPRNIGKKVLNQAVRKGAQVIRKDALQRLGPVGDKSAIVVRAVRDTDQSVHMKVGIARKWFFLLFREFGTRPHRIVAGKARARAGVLERTFGRRARVLGDPNTGQVFGPAVDHPGQPPRPFLRPAFDTRKGEALDAIGRELGEAIEKTAQKLAGSFAKSGLARRRRR